jgi:hypothetical protein
MSQWLRVPDLASASVLRGTAWWLQTAVVGKRPSSGGIHYGPLTRQWPQLGPHWAAVRPFGPGRAIRSGLGQLPFHVGRMLTLKVCVTKSSMVKLLLIILLAEFKDQ